MTAVTVAGITTKANSEESTGGGWVAGIRRPWCVGALSHQESGTAAERSKRKSPAWPGLSQRVGAAAEPPAAAGLRVLPAPDKEAERKDSKKRERET